MKIIYEIPKQNVYCRDSKHSSNTLGYRSHLHASVELAMVFEGHVRITVDSKTYDVRGGDAFVVFPNQIHYFETVEREQYVLLKFNPDILPEFLPQLGSHLPVDNIIPGAAQDSHLSHTIQAIADTYYSEDPFREEILRGYLLVFFGSLLPKMELRDIQSRDYNLLGMIMNYCISNYNQDLSLAKLEKDLHLSKYYISHVLSSKLHIGFNDYINSLRVSAACKLLSQTDKSITEISEEVGFNTLRTFNRAFLKSLDTTPSAYRKAKRKKGMADTALL